MAYPGGLSTGNTHDYIRTDIWSQEIKDILEAELYLQQYVRWITSDFPDGDEIHIPTMSELAVRDYAEGDDIVLDDPHDGEFTLQIDKYLPLAA